MCTICAEFKQELAAYFENARTVTPRRLAVLLEEIRLGGGA